MSDKNASVAIYNTHTEAEAAVKSLQKGGFDMKKLSIVGKDYQRLVFHMWWLTVPSR